ncbi:MAG: helix-turn-helix domain-containing protein [Lachnospiraceae bacterium]|nr:helix-turn-helix domain-containing protein [Lachnospiraceae bacterium]
MISGATIRKSIEDLHAITRVDFAVFESEGTLLGATWEEAAEFEEAVITFGMSPADSQEMSGCHFFKIREDDTPEYILIAKGGGEDVHVMGKVAVCQIRSLIVAYRERLDRNTFIQNLLLDNLLVVDIYNRAKKLHIEAEVRRVVFVVEALSDPEGAAMEVLKSLFAGSGKDFITAVDEHSIILVKELENNEDYPEIHGIARMIEDTLEAEVMTSARISYGTIVSDIQQVSRSYKEARMAMDVGKIFYIQHRVYSYRTLGIGRLIYQLPLSLCEMFIQEVFTGQQPDELDEETLTTINKFFENSLNVSETARQLFVHRNTLVYRLEKLQRATGLDIRNFEDALTFRIALMVENYMKAVRETEA